MQKLSKEELLLSLQKLLQQSQAYLEKLPVPKEQSIKKISLLITGVLSIVLFFQIVKLFLPSTGVHYVNNSQFVARHLYRLGDAFYTKELSPSTTELSTQTGTEKSYTPLTAWKVQAMFSEGDIGFIVVLIKGKTQFINLNESYDGYTLIKINNQQAILKRNGKEYALSLAISDKSIPKENLPVAPQSKEIDVAQLQEGIVQRKDINGFMQDPKRIWANIKVRPYKVQNKLAGFLVRYVKKSSVFDHLGLKSGDIILSANGIGFTSIQQAQDLYTNIDNIDNISLSIRRQGKIKELNYEIQ